MPEYTIELLQDQLNEIEKSLKGTTVGVLGLSYKANVGDLRESPSFELIKLLEKNGAKVITFDPFVPSISSAKSIDELLEKSEAILLATNHQEFIEIPVEKFVKNNIKVITDGKNCLDKDEIKKHGIIYKGIGR
jgi:UDP-N-acetyl-D-mannosaminuronate dehydrogenase